MSSYVLGARFRQVATRAALLAFSILVVISNWNRLGALTEKHKQGEELD